MNHPFVQLLLRWCVLAVGVTIATHVIDGIHCDSRETLIVVVLLLSFFNAILKPVLLLFALPFIVITLGLGVVVINALLIGLVGWFVRGFHVDGFWSAVGGAIIISLTTMVANRLIGDGGKGPRRPKPPGAGGIGRAPAPGRAREPEKRVPEGKGDVIDI